MSAYTITITPEDAADATTTLRLEESESGVRITDVHLHAPAGLRGGGVPPLNFGLLLRAVNPTEPDALVPTERSVPDAGVAAAPDPGTVEVTGSGVGDEPSVAEQDVAGTAWRARRSGTANSRPKRAGKASRQAVDGSTADGSTAGAKPAMRRTRAAKAAAKAAGRTRSGRAGAKAGRAYRRMPEDFADVYRQVGAASAIADHYQVPKHTAHGWIRRLRNQSAGEVAAE